MLRSSADELAREIFDPDMPNVMPASFGGGATFYGSLSREYVETDELVGVRSVFLCASADLDGLQAGDTLTIEGRDFVARVIEIRGRAIAAVVLGH